MEHLSSFSDTFVISFVTGFCSITLATVLDGVAVVASADTPVFVVCGTVVAILLLKVENKSENFHNRGTKILHIFSPFLVKVLKYGASHI